jgi:death-on-curing protein
LGVRLLHRIAISHAFLQGNKRTGWSAFLGFLRANGYWLDLADEQGVAQMVLDLVNGTLTPEELTEAVRPFVEPLRR